MKFGEEVEGYAVPVLNEREIRASAGILFIVLFMSFTMILFRQDFTLVKYVVIVFFADFSIRVFASPRYSPTLIIGRMMVSRQTPEYVAAAPKKFAWKIGLTLSAMMFLLLVLFNSYSFITGVTCLVCLLFLFFESSFGICLGCLFYGLFNRNKAIICAGDFCQEQKKHSIQVVSRTQVLIVLAAVACLVLAVSFFDDYFRRAPVHLGQKITR